MSDAATTRPSWLSWGMRHWAWLIVGLAVVFVVVVRVRLAEMPLERDEGEYAYAGQLILQGVPPYKEVYNMKLPGTYAAYAVIMAVFGQTPTGIHLGVMLVNAASILLVFVIGRRLLDDTAGVVAAVVFALMSLSPSVLGLAGHATHFVVLFALGGTLLLTGASVGGVLGVECRASGEGSESRKAKSETSPETENERTAEHAECAKGEAGRSPLFGIFRVFRGSKSRVTRHWPRVTLFPFLATCHSPLVKVFSSGCLFGLAFLMKQHGIFFGVFGVLYLVGSSYLEWRERVEAAKHPALRRPIFRSEAAQQEREARGQRSEIRGRRSEARTSTFEVQGSTVQPRPSPLAPRPTSILYQLSCFTAGLALPYLLTCLILWAVGVFPQFWFWTVSYASQYASAVGMVNGPAMLKLSLNAVVGPNIVFWLLPWAGALMMWWDERLNGEKRKAESGKRKARIANPRFFSATLLVCSLAAMSIGFYFREHYFILLLPVLALLSGLACSRAVHLLRGDRSVELLLALPVLLAFVIGVGAALFGNGPVWLSTPPAQAQAETYGTSIFSDSVRVADYLKSNTAPNAVVAVIGSEPQIYFYSHRRSATGYIYTFPLMETHPYALKMQEEMIRQIERARPEYVVYVGDILSWMPQPGAERRITDWFQSYWATNLDLAMSFDIQGGKEAEVLAGKTYGRELSSQMLVLKRKGS